MKPDLMNARRFCVVVVLISLWLTAVAQTTRSDVAPAVSTRVITLGTQGGLVPIVHEVYRDNTLRTTPRMLVNIPNEHGVPVPRYFVYTIVPTHEAGGKVDGVVLYADDISAQLLIGA